MRITFAMQSVLELESGSARAADSGAAPEKTMAQTMSEVRAAQRPQASMSRTEYAQYIQEKISAIPMDPSQSMNSVSVIISDEGLGAMQADEEYEAWVLDWLAQDFAFQDPWSAICGGHYVVHEVGATKEEYRGSGWYPQYAGGTGTELYADRSSGALWRRDVDTAGSSSKKKVEGLDLSARLRLERFLRKQALQRARQQSELLEQASKYRQSVEAMHANGSAPISKTVVGEMHGVPASALLGMLGGGIM